MSIQLKNQPAKSIQGAATYDDNLSERFMAAINQKKRDERMQQRHVQHDETSALQALIALLPQPEAEKLGLALTKEKQAGASMPTLSLNSKRIVTGKSEKSSCGSDSSRRFTLQPEQKTTHKEEQKQLPIPVSTSPFLAVASSSVNSEMKHQADVNQEKTKRKPFVCQQDGVSEILLRSSSLPMAEENRSSLSSAQNAPMLEKAQLVMDTRADHSIFSNIPHKNISLHHQGNEAELEYGISDNALARMTLSESTITLVSKNPCLDHLLTAQSVLAAGEWSRRQINDHPYYSSVRGEQKKNTEKVSWQKSEKEKR